MTLIAQIVNVLAPQNASPGSNVIVDVNVKNLGYAPGGYNTIAITGKFNGINLTWQFDPENWLYVAPQETVVFRGWFTMPSQKVTVTVWSWYWDGAQWVQDDTASMEISLEALAPTFSEFKISDYEAV